MKAKMKPRKFSEGGEVREGQNAGIGDDTRARAMAWVKSQSEGGSKPAPKAAAKPAPKAPASKDTGTSGDEMRAQRAAKLSAATPTRRVQAEGVSAKAESDAYKRGAGAEYLREANRAKLGPAERFVAKRIASKMDADEAKASARSQMSAAGYKNGGMVKKGKRGC